MDLNKNYKESRCRFLMFFLPKSNLLFTTRFSGGIKCLLKVQKMSQGSNSKSSRPFRLCYWMWFLLMNVVRFRDFLPLCSVTSLFKTCYCCGLFLCSILAIFSYCMHCIICDNASEWLVIFLLISNCVFELNLRQSSVERNEFGPIAKYYDLFTVGISRSYVH